MSMSELSFFKTFQKNNGRKFRVLHIGNIANNGFLNSKILNETKQVESYALSIDYYHIMGCPEWEEGRFHTESINQNKR